MDQGVGAGVLRRGVRVRKHGGAAAQGWRQRDLVVVAAARRKEPWEVCQRTNPGNAGRSVERYENVRTVLQLDCQSVTHGDYVITFAAEVGF